MIEAPAHPDNDRAIPLPKLIFDAKALPADTPTGRMIVRLDVDDHRSLQEVTAIHDDMGGVSPALLAAVQERFSLAFESDKQHRVVTYAVLEVGESTSIVDHVMVLPKCCPVVCPPNLPNCVEP